jgi:hypothetical protein
MTLLVLLLALAALGFVVAFPVVHKGLEDVGRIPGSVWRITGYANRRAWRAKMIVSYACGGWPSVVVVLIWRKSEEREILRDEWRLLVEERRARREIVLAHYEDQPGEAESSR